MKKKKLSGLPGEAQDMQEHFSFKKFLNYSDSLRYFKLRL